MKKTIQNKKYTGVWDDNVGLYRITRKKDNLQGGFIQRLLNLSEDGTCFIYDNAKVFDYARISGDVEVIDNVEISGDVEICGDAKISGDARIF